MESKEIFAQRLKNARVMKGFSMDELVAAMGNNVSKMTISKYEKCQMAPNSSMLISLANALEQPVDYFFRPFTLQIDSVKFRKTKSKLAAKQENAIKENVADLVERYMNIEEICNSSVKFVSPFEQSISSPAQIKEAAICLRNEWDIGHSGIINVIELLEEHGVKVLEIEAAESFDGLSSMVNEVYPVVILNKTYSSERKRFTALHELGHLLFTFDESLGEKAEESLCNLFASEMLIPESVFKDFIGVSRKDIPYQELKRLQMHYGISCDALMYKAKECGVISDSVYKSYCIRKTRNQWSKNTLEQSLYPQEESFRFESLVYKALSNELITISKASNLLHKSVDEIREELALV